MKERSRHIPDHSSRRRAAHTASRGLTIAELITVLGIIAVLSALALPVARFALRHEKEQELAERIHRVTDAIDRYHTLRVSGLIKAPPDLSAHGYPKKLEDLNSPVELIDGKTVLPLTRKTDLVDPMTGQPWRTISSTDDVDSASTNGDNVFDIRSNSTALALDGKRHYNEW